MKPLSEYDAVMIGEHPAGLWAALHLLNLGLKVLIVPTGTYGGGNVLPRKVAEAFGLTHLSDLQIVTPDRRIRIFSSEPEMKDEYRFNYGTELSPTKMPHPDFARGVAYWVRGSETGPILPDDWSTLSKQLPETVYFNQMPGYLSHALFEKLAQKGATVMKAGSLRQIFSDRKNMVGVQLADTSEMIAVKTLFANTHFDYLNSFLNEPLALRTEPVAWNFEITFECSTEFLPLGLTSRMIYVQKDAPILEIFQEMSGRFRLKTAVPFQEFSLDRAYQRRLAARTLKVCEELLPDLQYNLKRVSPDLRDPERAMAVELPALYPFQSLGRIPAALYTYSGPGLSPITPIQGLYLSNEEVNPRQGFWGAFEGVQKAMESIAKREQKPEWVKMPPLL